MFVTTIEDGLTIKTLGLTFVAGENCELAAGPVNFWIVIKDRELAIKALQHGCENGPPNIVVRDNRYHIEEEKLSQAVYPHRVVYKIGGLDALQHEDGEFPFGFAGIYIDTPLGEEFIEDGTLFLYCHVDNSQVHCYYTGPGSYFDSNKKQLVSHTDRITRETRAFVLKNHVVARVSENSDASDSELVQAVKDNYPIFNGFYFPDDTTILAQIKAHRAKIAA